MNNKYVVLFLWNLASALAFMFSVWFFMGPITYEGKQIHLTVQTGEKISINATTATVTGGTCSLFTLRNVETRELVVGQPTDPLLGGGCPDYHYVESREISGGTWLADIDGLGQSVTLLITSDYPAVVTVKSPLIVDIIVFLVMLGVFVLVWIFVRAGIYAAYEPWGVNAED